MNCSTSFNPNTSATLFFYFGSLVLPMIAAVGHHFYLRPVNALVDIFCLLIFFGYFSYTVPYVLIILLFNLSCFMILHPILLSFTIPGFCNFLSIFQIIFFLIMYWFIPGSWRCQLFPNSLKSPVQWACAVGMTHNLQNTKNLFLSEQATLSLSKLDLPWGHVKVPHQVLSTTQLKLLVGGGRWLVLQEALHSAPTIQCMQNT